MFDLLLNFKYIEYITLYEAFLKILRIDLNKKEFIVEPVDSGISEMFLGGRGLAGHFFKEGIKNGSQPLVFFSGALNGSGTPSSSCFSVVSKSPQTGKAGLVLSTASFGSHLKKAGLSGIIITGKSSDKCGIEISDTNFKFTDATDMTGLETGAVNDMLEGKGATAVIGPAAENGVMFSTIVFDRHFYSGRFGLGLAMAEKGIKYITVKGTDTININDRAAFIKAGEDINRLINASAFLMGEFGIAQFGTAALIDIMNNHKKLPGALTVNAFCIKTRISPRKDSCDGCIVGCRRLYAPDYEALIGLGAHMRCNSVERINESVDICREHGMDPIGAAGIIPVIGKSYIDAAHFFSGRFSSEMIGKPFPVKSIPQEENEKAFEMLDNTSSAFDALGVCRHILAGVGLEEYSKALSALTGRTISAQNLLEAGAAARENETALETASSFNTKTIIKTAIMNTVFFDPPEPYKTIILCLTENGSSLIKPKDCETRTFLHDIPVVENSDAEIAAALSNRKGVIIRKKGIVIKAISRELAFPTFSSICFAVFIKFFTDYLTAIRKGTVTSSEQIAFEKVLPFLKPIPEPKPLITGPFTNKTDITEAISQAGKAVVESDLVDSNFGNISYKSGGSIYISRTGASLDSLENDIVACPLDNSSCAGITASSEFATHRSILTSTDNILLLHGHPKFSVILSMDCQKENCDNADSCGKTCPEKKDVCGIPVVHGEIGSGEFGICRTVPDALKTSGAVIVYGHGVFTTGKTDFNEAFSSLVSVEKMCMEEYFRRVKHL